MKRITIAIDGPAAAGKSTVARLVAQKINYLYIDSGAMYRALTLKALNKGIDITDEKALLELLLVSKIELKDNIVYLDGKDITLDIRAKQVSENVSMVSSHGMVRQHLVLLQQQFGKDGGIVMDGRDIGTCVFPDAELKIFQVASVKQRALRRYEEYKEKGIICDIKCIEADIRMRDFKDTTRKVSPLKKARDAHSLDTSFLTPQEACDKIIALYNKLVGDDI